MLEDYNVCATKWRSRDIWHHTAFKHIYNYIDNLQRPVEVIFLDGVTRGHVIPKALENFEANFRKLEIKWSLVIFDHMIVPMVW